MQRTVEPQESNAIDWRDMLWKVRRYGWLLLLPPVAVLCVAAMYYKFTTPVYTSSILVSVGEKDVSEAIQNLVGDDRQVGAPRTIVESRIQSRGFLVTLAERTGLTRNPALLERAKVASQQSAGVPPEELVLRSATTMLSRKISVSQGRAALIRISVVDSNPEGARRLASMIGTLLIEDTRRTDLARGMARGEFTSDQMAVYEERLRKDEEALRAFEESRIRHRLTSGDVNEENLKTARNLLAATDEETEQVKSRIRSGSAEWAEVAGDAPVPDLSSPRVSEWTRMLGNLEASYATSLVAGSSQEDRNELQTRIAAVRQSLFTELNHLTEALPSSISDAARASASGVALDRAILRSLLRRKEKLNQDIASYMSGAQSSPRDELDRQRLTANVTTSRGLVDALRKEAASSRLSEALATSALGPRIDIVESALQPIAPSSPEPVKIFGVALVLGPLISLGLVFAGERLNSVLRTTEQAEGEFGVAVIGTVPRMEGWPKPGSYLGNHWALFAILLVLLVTGIVFAVDAVLPGSKAGPVRTTELRR
ncbi:MAG TPA: Wzz/FepE/Etk N-terminal domain-containing protein [Candidatus Eisenbacteria bacterium]|nr:Wzz/FepE/Etk N-terminal domain-containing protein [Candidatus Eisenbacteria bacterium]